MGSRKVYTIWAQGSLHPKAQKALQGKQRAKLQEQSLSPKPLKNPYRALEGKVPLQGPPFRPQIEGQQAYSVPPDALLSAGEPCFSTCPKVRVPGRFLWVDVFEGVLPCDVYRYADGYDRLIHISHETLRHEQDINTPNPKMPSKRCSKSNSWYRKSPRLHISCFKSAWPSWKHLLA